MSFGRTTFLALMLGVALSVAAQQAGFEQPQQQQPAPAPGSQATNANTAPAAASTDPAGPSTRDLIIGPGDEGDMTVYGMPEMTQHFRVGADGEVNLPLIGRVNIGGITSPQAESLIEKKYIDGGFLRNPHINVFIKESNSQSVTILGEVAHPGSYSLSRARRLYDAFQVAGGLTAKAGNKVVVSHKGSPTTDSYPLSNDPMVTAANNVDLKSGDTIVVTTAGIVYVVGEVIRPGGFVVETGRQPSVSQALAMASGPTRLANLSHARVIRKSGAGLENKEVDLKKILSAKVDDFPLQPDDILFVPTSRGKMAMSSSSSSLLSMVTQLAIYRF